ncbi:MAG: trypsin-like serine protease [Myxococcota bacterium]
MSLPKAYNPLIGVFLLVLSACGDPDGLDVDSSESAIVGGWAATSEQIFATVELRRKGGVRGFCSGVLISRSLVATAAHCAVVEYEEGVIRGAAPGSLEVIAGHLSATSMDPTMARTVIEVRVHEDYDHDYIMGRSRQGAGKGGIGSPNDLALLFLEEPFEGVANAPMLDVIHSETLVRHGDVGFVAGYGTYDVEKDLSGELHISDAIIDILGARELLTRRPDQLGDSCYGDSGGPFYLPTEQGSFLVGLVSRGRSDVSRDCGDGGVYTLLSAYLPWIERTAGVRFDPRVPAESAAIAFRPSDSDYVPPSRSDLERVRACAASEPGQGSSSLWLMLLGVLVIRRTLRPRPH